MLRAQAAPGRGLTFRIDLQSWWSGVENAIGGGPVLVRGGVAVYRPDEWFTRSQLVPRHPRTAVGQRADGTIILLVADGRSSASRGLTNRQLANQMVHYGAVDAMAFDSGGSSTLAFNGAVLNRPSDGFERRVADSFQLIYIGAYARKPRRSTFSPNGDGFADTQTLYAKLVRASTVDIKLYRPNGTVKWSLEGQRAPGTLRKSFSGSGLAEGAWRWVVGAVDDKGRSSRMERRFRVNNTLGFLTLSKSVMRVRPGLGGRLRVGFRLAHTANVRVAILNRKGRLVRTLVVQSDLKPGGYAVIWDGRNRNGRVVHTGRYVVTVRAANVLGRVTQPKRFVVRRIS